MRPLAEALERLHIRVWFDEYSVTLGDSIWEEIERGLRETDFGLVILSPAFLRETKRYPRFELEGLIARELGENRKIILPLLHNVSEADIRRRYPALSGKKFISTTGGLHRVLDEIVKAMSAIGSDPCP